MKKPINYIFFIRSDPDPILLFLIGGRIWIWFLLWSNQNYLSSRGPDPVIVSPDGMNMNLDPKPCRRRW